MKISCTCGKILHVEADKDIQNICSCGRIWYVEQIDGIWYPFEGWDDGWNPES